MSQTSAICPGCDGPKTRRAELCRKCRRTANEIGAHVVTDVAQSRAPEHRLRTAVQNTVYHARCSDLARLEDPSASPADHRLQVIQVKEFALEHARQQTGHAIESSTELTELEMERLLEWLDRQYLERSRARQPM